MSKARSGIESPGFICPASRIVRPVITQKIYSGAALTKPSKWSSFALMLVFFRFFHALDWIPVFFSKPGFVRAVASKASKSLSFISLIMVKY